MKLLLVTILLVASAMAQSPSPIVVEKAIGCGQCGRWGQRVDYKNISDKEVDAVKFRVDFVDEMGDTRQTEIFYTNTINVKPGKKHTGQAGYTDQREWDYQIHEALPPNHVKLRFVPVKVKFSDGTEWSAN
jgi:hypothetical protein